MVSNKELNTMTRTQKEALIASLVEQLIALDANGEHCMPTFLMGKFNTVRVNGKMYLLKLIEY